MKTLLAFLFLMTSASAQGFDLAPGESLVAVDGIPVAHSIVIHRQVPARPIVTSLLQRKADRMANAGRCYHVGMGYVRGARSEGVGFSTSSAAAALRACCYYGQRAIVSQAVSRGRLGFYAVIQYR